MLNVVRYVTALLVFLVIYVTVLAPVLSQLTGSLQSATPQGPLSGIIDPLETAMYVGMPLVLAAGVLLIGFIIAVGIRGTSR